MGTVHSEVMHYEEFMAGQSATQTVVMKHELMFKVEMLHYKGL